MIGLYPSCFFVCHLTLRCNYGCSYCIQSHDTGSKELFYQYEEQPAQFWIDGINRFSGQTVYLSGGEILLLGHDYLAELINGIRNFSQIVVGSNIYSKTELELLVKNIHSDKEIIFGVSYQHECTTREAFLTKLSIIRAAGFRIDPSMLRTNSFWDVDYRYFKDNGYFFTVNPYQGFSGGVLQPQEFETSGGRKYRRKVRCFTTIRAVAPNGVVYPCAHLAYTASSHSCGMLDTITADEFGGDIFCDQYGWCNPCCVRRIEIREEFGDAD